MVIYDNINNESQYRPRLLNIKITEKQFLAYYIYRIWIKYRKLMEDVNTPIGIKSVLKYMEVPAKYHDIYLTYPMTNKMPINEKQLDLIILSMLKQLNQVYKIYGQHVDGTTPPANKDYKMLNIYLTGKTIENIIQDIIQIKLLVPNLSRPANVRNIWDGIDQMLDDIDVVEPVSYENPATEIPDTKLSGIDSGISNIATASINKSQPNMVPTQDTSSNLKLNISSRTNNITPVALLNKNIVQSNVLPNTVMQNNKPDIRTKQTIATKTNTTSNLSSSKSSKNFERVKNNNTSARQTTVK